MKDILIKKLEDKKVFRETFGLQHSFLAIAMAIFFFIIGICIWALYYFGHLLNKGEASFIAGVIIVLALIIWLVENITNRMKFNKYYGYFMKADKKEVPCYLIQEDFKKMGAMRIDTYVISPNLGEMSDQECGAAASTFKFNRFSITNNFFSSGIIPISKLSLNSEGGYTVSVFSVNLSDDRDETGARIWSMKKVIFTDQYVFYSQRHEHHKD